MPCASLRPRLNFNVERWYSSASTDNSGATAADLKKLDDSFQSDCFSWWHFGAYWPSGPLQLATRGRWVVPGGGLHPAHKGYSSF